MNTNEYVKDLEKIFKTNKPWEFLTQIESHIEEKIKLLGDDYIIKKNIAIHKTATIEKNAVLKGPIIIDEEAFVASFTYLRGGVYLGKKSVIGPHCEIKSTIILEQSSVSHLTYIGNSIIGSHVDIEAGSIFANYYNERKDKTITITINRKKEIISVDKFGAVVGDYSNLGANCTLSPGTILEPKSTIGRLQLIQQN